MKVTTGEPSGSTWTSLGMNPKCRVYQPQVAWKSASSMTTCPSFTTSGAPTGTRWVSSTLGDASAVLNCVSGARCGKAA